ncbi:MAG: peptidoglycan editing factor PgeF [Rhodocyclaceae bacterium]|nr:peptidoglycan editing factor PgeF [Rhodocyclaceae bacterium]
MDETFLLRPDWPAPGRVRALVTTRGGGVSRGPYASLNLGAHVGDDPQAVACNRELLSAMLPSAPAWLDQVHGTDVIELSERGWADGSPCADAAIARRAGEVCVVMTADCLPVLLCDQSASVVAAAHAGWRGLAAGILERTVRQMGVAPSRLMAWMGPAIGPGAFEVGPEVREVFIAEDGDAAGAFVPRNGDRWLADLYQLAQRRLLRAGVGQVFGGGRCTWSDPERFYSFRRERVTGRFASLVWLDPDG